MFDRIYSIGCFDHFHFGHQILLQKMRKLGKQLIIGIHDDASLEKLKKLKPSSHQDLKTRMQNVKKYADVVFIIPDTEPSFYLNCVLHDEDNLENACFVRADDMPNFPGKLIVENRISLLFLPYTEGISSTIIREKLI